MLFFMGIASIVFAQSKVEGTQPKPKSDAHTVLIELGKILEEKSETKEECQALLTRIKTWQSPKLKNLESGEDGVLITAPLDKSEVDCRTSIQGTASDTKWEVWIIIHPMETGDYWVQPSITVQPDGTWEVIAYIGEPAHIGKKFEIMAVVNPQAKLHEGDKLKGWPQAQQKSKVIKVVRK